MVFILYLWQAGRRRIVNDDDDQAAHGARGGD